MHSQLEAILADRRRDLQSLPHACPRSSSPQRPFKAALTTSGLGVIAEIKRRSPSVGMIRNELDPASIAQDCEAHGAVALSVLTEGTHFGGSIQDLVAARDAVALPVLRKDFIVDERQLEETQACGADAVLLIVRVLGPQLGAFLERCDALNLDALVEVHDAQELARALAAGAQIIGINNRNLNDFHVDSTTALRLCTAIPKECVSVAESGIRIPEDLQDLTRVGFDACLIGSALMRAERPGEALDVLRGSRP